MNATPGPIVSGRYRSGDIAFSCTQVMPLTLAGISSKSGPAAETRDRQGENAAAAPSTSQADRLQELAARGDRYLETDIA